VSDDAKIPVAVCSGTREVIGGIALDAYNLDDGRRVISQSGILRALSPGNKDFGRMLARLPNGSGVLSSPPVTFRLASGAHAKGYEASTLIDLCQAFQAAFLSGELHSSQEPMARAAMALLGGFAKLGVDAWVDETTGYQKYRDGSELGRRLVAYLRDTFSPWAVMWKPSLVKALCALEGDTWSGGSQPRWMGSTIRKLQDIILGTEVMTETKLRNPEPRWGSNHHQLLQEPARSYFAAQLETVETIAKQSSTKADFWRRIECHYLGKPFQTSF